MKAKTKEQVIEGQRIALERRGFTLRECRACKLCGVQIEIWLAPDATKLPLELHPELDWKLTLHSNTCHGAKPSPKKTLPAESRELF